MPSPPGHARRRKRDTRGRADHVPKPARRSCSRPIGSGVFGGSYLDKVFSQPVPGLSPTQLGWLYGTGRRHVDLTSEGETGPTRMLPPQGSLSCLRIEKRTAAGLCLKQTWLARLVAASSATCDIPPLQVLEQLHATEAIAERHKVDLSAVVSGNIHVVEPWTDTLWAGSYLSLEASESRPRNPSATEGSAPTAPSLRNELSEPSTLT